MNILTIFQVTISFIFVGSPLNPRSIFINATQYDVMVDDAIENEENNNNISIQLGWNWEMWWTYDGISGPEFWGVINPAFAMCSEGRRQSPINLDPRTMLYDPNLTPVKMDQKKISGTLVNTGHSLEWRANSDTESLVKISGGPLSYSYTVSFLRLHFGERDLQGSEHTISNYAFPAELKIYGFNSQLYKNFSQSSSKVYGVVSIANVIQLGDKTSPALKIMLEELSKVIFGGSAPSRDIQTSDLLSTTDHYMTYEGSLTEPACYETVTWIVPNKPLYISFSQMRELRSLRQGSSTQHRNAPLGNNFRPVQSGHHRTVRTNIDFSYKSGKKSKCAMGEAKYHYRANENLHL